ncbi:hypothetical protein SAMN05421741_13616 [Paenimyroides ummariense]|uniref:Uncharacterized protein n=1 Tax=Paenimyroides ummariense TaxID=913024 RepID=A0A1I5G7A3_9FLAO|nr:hypothetical protein [Paenimyroides ummariense]SFO31729.1 hypothetical protein SAMN05421741_13616 [Paenimyroides ummariense]
MKKIYSIVLTALCFVGYAQSEDRLLPNHFIGYTSDFPDGETFNLNQEALEKKYLEAKNYNLYASLKEQFFNSNNADSEIIQLISMDLNSIAVYESQKMHTITYKVSIGEDELNQDGEPLVVYNLMHFSKDYHTYQFTLLRYDFSKTSYEDYIANPHESENVLSFIPLSDIGNIYENIAYSFAKELLINPDLLSKDAPFYTKMIDFGNCATAINVAGVACKTCGLHFYETADRKYCPHKDPEVSPKPAYTFLDLSPCKGKLETKEIDLASF